MSDDRTPAATPRKRRWVLATLAIVVAALALAIAAFVAWLSSESALRRALDEVTKRTNGELAFEAPAGSLLSTMRARRIVWRSERFEVVVDDVSITWSPAALRRHELRIDDARAARMSVSIVPSGESTPLPSSLALPLDVTIARAAVSRLVVKRGDVAQTLDALSFGYEGGATVHALRNLALASAWGRIGGETTIAAQPPFGLRGALSFVGSDAAQNATANVTLGGSLDAVDVRFAARAHDATATGDAKLAPFADVRLASVSVDARDVDPAQFGVSAPAMRVAATIDARADGRGRYVGSVEANNGEPGPIDSDRVPVASLASRYAITRERLDLDGAVVDFGPGGRASGSGHVELASQARVPPSEWDVSVRDLDLAKLHTRAIATKLAGRVRAQVERGRERVDADLAQGDRALSFVATIAGDDVDVERFRARAEGGEASGRARLSLAGAKAFDVTATAKRFDPSRFVAFPKASVDATIAASGEIGPPWRAQGDVTVQPSSRLAGLAVSGSARGRVSAAEAADVAVAAKLGDAALHANGSFGKPGDALAFDVDVPKLDSLASIAGERWPAGMHGGVRAHGTVRGSPDAPGIDVDARGTRIAYGAYSASSVDVRASIAPGRTARSAAATPLDARAMSVAVDAAGVGSSDRRYARATFAIDGTLARHVATLAIAGDDIDAHARLEGGFTAASTIASPAWTGRLAALDNRGAYPVHLASPARLALSRGSVDVGEARVAIADGSFRIATFEWLNGRIETRGDFAAVPVAAVAQLAGHPLPMRSTLVLAGDWNVSASPELAGTMHVRRESGDVYAVTGVAASGGFALGLETLDVTATIANDTLDATATMRGSAIGSARATMRIGGVGRNGALVPPDAPVSATLAADMSSLAPLQPLIGTNAVVDGRVSVNGQARGTRRELALSGAVFATDVKVVAPRYGIDWTNGRVRARLADGALVLDELAIEGGDGRFAAHGTLVGFGKGDGATTTSVNWRAEDFRAMNRPDMRLVVDGNGTLGASQQRLLLKGNLKAREGHFEIARENVYTLGPDVVVVGAPREAPRERAGQLPLAVDLELDLGDRLDVVGRGLDARLSGRLHVASTASGDLTARGTIQTVNGTYDAFGQRLTITRGRLIFDGPIDNPALDVVAVRRNLPVEAGVEVTGNVNLPHVALTSDPPVPDNEKLSWLVLGHAPELTSATEMAALSAAAATLFGENKAPLGATLARRFGLDEISVRAASTSAATTSGGGNALSGQVLALSKRLSDRVYVIYEQGLSAASNALKIEYVLTRNITLRGEAGKVSGLGIYYQRSFD